MKKGYAHITTVMDCSGSVSIVVDEMRQSYNKFIKEQIAAGGEVTVSFYKFNDEVKVVDYFRNISDCTHLDEGNFIADGMTALHDAIGIAIKDTGSALAKMPEKDRPSTVFFYVNTDGMNNASKEFTKSKVLTLVKHQEEKYNWKFIFAGANIDVDEVGTSVGFLNNTAYTQDSAGIHGLYKSLSYSVASVRNADLSKLDSKDAEDLFKQNTIK